MKLDPEAVEREMNGLAVGVRGEAEVGKARFGIRLYRLAEDLVGVDWSSASFLFSSYQVTHVFPIRGSCRCTI